jgi:Tfp pilus assembly protein PilF
MIERAGIERAHAMGIFEDLATAMLRAGIAVTDLRDRARYHLRAVFRGTGDKSRLTFRLLDAATGQHVWAYDLDGEIGSDLDDVEHFAMAVVAAMQPALRAAEIDRIRQKPDADLVAHELTMKAWPYVTALDAEKNQRAIELLERATSRDPDHALALALMAWCYGQRAIYQFSANVSDARSRATSLAERAARLSCDATTLSVLGHAMTCAHDLKSADLFPRRALMLDGGSHWAWSRSAWIETYRGHAEMALERFAISLQLAPHDSMAFNNFAGIGCVYLHLNRYSEAARWTARAIAEHPPAAWAHRVLCPMYALGGRKAEAQSSLAVVQRLYPGRSAAQCAAAMPLPRSDQDRIADGLETVGLRA